MCLNLRGDTHDLSGPDGSSQKASLLKLNAVPVLASAKATDDNAIETENAVATKIARNMDAPPPEK